MPNRNDGRTRLPPRTTNHRPDGFHLGMGGDVCVPSMNRMVTPDTGSAEDVSLCWNCKCTQFICEGPNVPPPLRRDKSEWCPTSFDIRKSLYKGKASLLYVATDRHSARDVVLKIYRKSKLSKLNRYQVEREIGIHRRLEHEHIIALYAAFEDPKYVYLVQEYAEGGDLFGRIKECGGHLKEHTAVYDIIHPFLKVLRHLHSMNIIHRDIKPENILLTIEDVLKLADFGLSIDVTKERPVTRAGTLDYMAPEVLVCPDKKTPEENKDNLSLAYGRQIDTWAAGILAYELVVGYPPFEKESRAETYDHIMRKNPVFPTWMSDDCKDFIRQALQKNSSDRPTVGSLLLHPWIQAHRRTMSCELEYALANVPQVTPPSPLTDTTCKAPDGIGELVECPGDTKRTVARNDSSDASWKIGVQASSKVEQGAGSPMTADAMINTDNGWVGEAWDASAQKNEPSQRTGTKGSPKQRQGIPASIMRTRGTSPTVVSQEKQTVGLNSARKGNSQNGSDKREVSGSEAPRKGVSFKTHPGMTWALKNGAEEGSTLPPVSARTQTTGRREEDNSIEWHSKSILCSCDIVQDSGADEMMNVGPVEEMDVKTVRKPKTKFSAGWLSIFGQKTQEKAQIDTESTRETNRARANSVHRLTPSSESQGAASRSGSTTPIPFENRADESSFSPAPPASPRTFDLRPSHRLNREITGSQMSFTSVCNRRPTQDSQTDSECISRQSSVPSLTRVVQSLPHIPSLLGLSESFTSKGGAILSPIDPKAYNRCPLGEEEEDEDQ